MNNIKLVVFDLAGTTVHDDGTIVVAFQEAMDAFGYAVTPEAVNPLMGYHKPLAIKKMLIACESDAAKITNELIDEIHARFQHEMIQFYKTSSTVEPLPFAEAAFAELQSRGVKVGLNTGFSKAIADTVLQRLGWLENGLANMLVASDEVPSGRPDPFMIHRMMEVGQIIDSKAVVKVGDTEVDVMEGKNARCLLSIAVTTGAFTKEALLPFEPDYILKSLEELVPILEAHI